MKSSVERYVARWSIEVAIEDVEQFFDVGQARDRVAAAVHPRPGPGEPGAQPEHHLGAQARAGIERAPLGPSPRHPGRGPARVAR
jgi:hypothetical protein